MSTVEAPEAPATKPAGDALGTGRRKTAVARVRVRAGSGKITINQRPFDEFFLNDADRKAVLAPLNDSGKREEVDVIIRVGGGGTTGQSGACRMGIARALIKYDQALFESLRDNGHLTRDARMVERKKYGLHGARRGTQFSKR
jgi:small subunit ribosomal protein S9